MESIDLRKETEKRPSFLLSYGLVLIAIAVACAIVSRPPFRADVLGQFFFFPLGLLHWAHLDKGQYAIFLFAAWGLYAGLTLAVMQARRKRKMFALYAVLLLLVICGAVGCRQVLFDAEKQTYSI